MQEHKFAMKNIGVLKFLFPSRNLMRKLPRESSPLFKKLLLEPGAVTAQDILSFNKQFDFDDVWIFHGAALKQNKRAIILSGPSGIGKSSLLRKIVRMRMAEAIDDGFILVGRANCSYFVLESGLYPAVRTISVVSKCLRVLFRYQCPYLGNHRAVVRKKSWEMMHNIAALIGSIVSKDRSSERVTSSPVRLAKLFLVADPNDDYPPIRLCGETIESLAVGNAEKILDNYASCEVINSCEGLKRTLYDRIVAELRN